MTDAFVLMTAMPPTKGHLNLIRFAQALPVDCVIVLVCTQPSEPFHYERYEAVRDACAGLRKVNVTHLFAELEQDPEAPGFWKMWDKIMKNSGFRQGDYVVSSELYGATLAKRLDGVFMPYDPNREIYYTKATDIREHLVDYFHDILPEFQKYLVTRVTVFGAESTGKTTLSHDLSYDVNGHWLFEWARPYLMTVGKEITVDKMKAIWYGQYATQRHATFMTDKPFIIQDTDLFSTVGYWEQPHWRKDLGECPQALINDAIANKSDLYIITRSNIPFERDEIRYGIDKRESPDEYWIALAEKYNLNYVVLDSDDHEKRLHTAVSLCYDAADEKAESIYYDRRGL